MPEKTVNYIDSPLTSNNLHAGDRPMWGRERMPKKILTLAMLSGLGMVFFGYVLMAGISLAHASDEYSDITGPLGFLWALFTWKYTVLFFAFPQIFLVPFAYAGVLRLFFCQMRPAKPRILVDEALWMVSASYQKKGVSLTSNLSLDAPAVQVDRDKLLLVFVHLLDNALKHTPSNGGVTISASKNANMLEFLIDDTGCGIDPAYWGKLFRRYGKIPGDKTPGVGIGLSIAQKIIRAHKGKIWIEKKQGTGCAFVFSVRQNLP